MGGGGGAGHGNNAENGTIGFDGGAGGGIILIIADELVGNGNAIRAAGADVPGTINIFDGQGGGGGGGTVLLSLNTLDPTALTVDVTGGDGGDTDSFNNCEGPGGGGGGGVIRTNLASWTATPLVNGGQAGQENGAFGCTPNAIDGSSGTTILSAPMFVASISNGGCVLPVVLDDWQAELRQERVRLSWASSAEINHQAYGIQRRNQAGDWETLTWVPAAGSVQTGHRYQWVDYWPQPGLNQYRLAFLSQSGATDFAEIRSVQYQPSQRLQLLHLRQEEDRMLGRIHLPSTQPWRYQVMDLSGRILLQDASADGQRIGLQPITVVVGTLPAGVYLVSLEQGGQRITQRIMWQ